MIESFIKDWNQNIKNENLDLWWLSVTDECIGIEKTTELIKNMYENI